MFENWIFLHSCRKNCTKSLQLKPLGLHYTKSQINQEYNKARWKVERWKIYSCGTIRQINGFLSKQNEQKMSLLTWVNWVAHIFRVEYHRNQTRSEDLKSWSFIRMRLFIYKRIPTIIYRLDKNITGVVAWTHPLMLRTPPIRLPYRILSLEVRCIKEN